MCFTVPLKVEKVIRGTAVVEGGLKIALGRDVRTRKGQYVQVVGNIAVGQLTASEGKKIRSVIARLNQNYD